MIELNRACGLGRSEERRIDDIFGDGGKPGRYRLVNGRAVRVADCESPSKHHAQEASDLELLRIARSLQEILNS